MDKWQIKSCEMAIRDCEARLYFEGDYSCGGQDPYGKTFKFKYTKYHDNDSYSCK